jgi:hypothetical protein
VAIDWNATGSMLQGWAAFAGAAAIAWAAKKGSDTFGAWKQQKVAERKSAQAEQILTATYNARRALGRVRSPWMHGFELTEAESKLKEDAAQWDMQSKDRQKRLTTLQAYYHRLDRVKEERELLEQCLAMARALFGEEVEQSIEKLLHQFWIVQVDAESYADDDGADQNFTKKIRRGIYDISAREGEVNEVTAEIGNSVYVIEAHCLPALRMEKPAS